MIRYGTISEIQPDTGRVRVRFEEDEFVTAPLPVLFPATSGDEYFFLPDEGTYVAVMLDHDGEDGIVLGAIYTSGNKPSQGAADKTYIKFKDGTVISYDRSAHKYTVTMNTTTYEISRSGFNIQRGSESLKKIISDTLDGIAQLTVTCASPGSPSTIPVNLVIFQQIKLRLSNLLT